MDATSLRWGSIRSALAIWIRCKLERRVSGEQGREQRRAAAEVHRAPKHAFEGLGGGFSTVAVSRNHGPHPVADHIFQDDGEELFFVAKELVEQTVGNSGLLGDARHRRARVAVAGRKQFPGRVQDSGASLLALILPAGEGRPGKVFSCAMAPE